MVDFKKCAERVKARREEREKERFAFIQWCNAILEQGRSVTKWERDFAESLLDQLNAGNSLSERQAEILERIYAEKTP